MMQGSVRGMLMGLVCCLVLGTGAAQAPGAASRGDAAGAAEAPAARSTPEAQAAEVRARLLPHNVQVRNVSASVRNALSSAQDALAQGETGKALRLFEAVLSAEPANHHALTGKAVALQKLGRSAESQQVLQAARAAGGDGFVLQANMALVLAERDPRAAAAALSRPAPAEQAGAYHAVMGQISAMSGDYLQAADHWERALRQNPSSATLLWNHAVALDHLDRRAEAIERYRAALLVLAGQPAQEESAQLQRNALARLQFLEASMAASTPAPAAGR